MKKRLLLLIIMTISSLALADLKIPEDDHPSNGCGWDGAPSIYKIAKSSNNSCTPADMCMGDVICKGGVQSKCAYLVKDGKCGSVRKCYDDQYTAWEPTGRNVDKNDEMPMGSSRSSGTRQ
jgi:hypothetical protein